MNKEKKETAKKSLTDLLRSIESDNPTTSRDSVFSVISAGGQDLFGAVAGSPRDIMFALVMAAKKDRNIRHIIRMTEGFLESQDDKSPMDDLLDKVIKLADKVDCPCPMCVQSRASEGTRKVTNPADIN